MAYDNHGRIIDQFTQFVADYKLRDIGNQEFSEGKKD